MGQRETVPSSTRANDFITRFFFFCGYFINGNIHMLRKGALFLIFNN